MRYFPEKFSLFPKIRYFYPSKKNVIPFASMTIEDIALQMTPGIGPKGAVHLLEQFGDARSVFAATAGELTGKAELRPDLVQQIVRRKGFSAAEKELAYCRRNGIAAIASPDP